MSAPDALPGRDPGAGVGLGGCLADVVELAALRRRASELEALAGRRGLSLPACGRLQAARDTLVLCVRPERWLLLTAPASAGSAASFWADTCAGIAAAIDHSSGLTALHLEGPQVREALARGCRLDLDPEVFPSGHAAATIMAQVPAILAAVPSAMLILTPASTARHLREWLASVARPFGLAARADVTVAAVSGDPYA